MDGAFSYKDPGFGPLYESTDWFVKSSETGLWGYIFNKQYSNVQQQVRVMITVRAKGNVKLKLFVN